MAKSNWGITSGFIGKLGNVVGFNWKGKNIQRALTQSGSKSRTQQQALQRERFALITWVGSNLYEAIYEGFRHEADKQRSTQNGLFIKHNIGLVTGNDPEALGLDFENLQLSLGSLRGVDFGEASLSGNVLTVAIDDNNLYGRRVSISDRIYLVAYCPELGDARCYIAGTRASEGDLTVSLPAKWNGKGIVAYGFTVGAASFNEGVASATQCLLTHGTILARRPNRPTTSNASSGSQTGNNSGNSGSSTPSTGSGTGSETGGNNGGSNDTNNTVTVAAPTISGSTPFAESTQVTISGPDSAELHYTTDGSTPTTESTLYSEALTLTDTTTVKAIAIKDGVSSAVTSKIFTKSAGGENPETE